MAEDEEKASAVLSDALAAVREVWEPETTARNLRLIRQARERMQEMIIWANKIEKDLSRMAKK